ncbi:MAG: putative ATPase [Conexibacter sp.]|nr:putative ATPase [Conexibacter sp.]
MAEHRTDLPGRGPDAADGDSAARELDAIATALAHDLRAPLRAIDGFSRILLADHAGTLPEATERYLALVRDAGTELADLLDGLVDIVRMSQVPLDLGPRSPGVLAAELVEAVLAPRAVGRDVTWVIGDVPGCRADQALLRRLLEELLDNALKFTSGQASARIELGWDVDAGAYFVRDDGIGVDGELPEQAFAIFGRLQSREAFAGTGAGLAIAARIAARHGGRVWGRGTPGGGLTVWFTIA